MAAATAIFTIQPANALESGKIKVAKRILDRITKLTIDEVENREGSQGFTSVYITGKSPWDATGKKMIMEPNHERLILCHYENGDIGISYEKWIGRNLKTINGIAILRKN